MDTMTPTKDVRNFAADGLTITTDTEETIATTKKEQPSDLTPHDNGSLNREDTQPAPFTVPVAPGTEGR